MQFAVRQQSFSFEYFDRNLKAPISSWDEYKIAGFKVSVHKTKASSNLSSSNKSFGSSKYLVENQSLVVRETPIRGALVAAGFKYK